MKEDTSKIVLCAKGKTAGFFSLPYGSNMLRSENVVNEFSLYSDDVAELAIINAQEKARAKQLTTSFGEINMNEAMDLTQNSSETENTADGAREDGLSALDAVSEGTKEEEMLDENGFIVYKKPGLSDDDDDEETVNREDFAAAERKQKIYVKKAPKKLPKFMQRPIPETQEETEVENFRIFTKRILLALRACKASNMFFDAEFALLNMPREFGFITERINEEKDKNGIEFRNFLTDSDTNTDLIQNLELYGGLFLTNFNKSQNF